MKNLVEYIQENCNNNLVTEFLSSVNRPKFMKILKRKFDDYMYDDLRLNKNTSWFDKEFPDNSEDIILFFPNKSYLNDTQIQVELVKFCRKFNYMVSCIDIPKDVLGKELENPFENGAYPCITITAIQSKKTCPISKYSKPFYHLTTKELWETKIKHRGLRCIGGSSSDVDDVIINNPSFYDFGSKSDKIVKGTSNSFTPRIFLVSNDIESSKGFGLKNFMHNDLKIKKEDVIVLQIDLSKNKNITLYEDTFEPKNRYAWYTLENIPPELIKVNSFLTRELQH